jgi:hypothetical protein
MSTQPHEKEISSPGQLVRFPKPSTLHWRKQFMACRTLPDALRLAFSLIRFIEGQQRGRPRA